jgi:predicted Zn finger-like uncharacterized protein
MIVECPRCNARYRVEEEILNEQPTFKCSRCSHVFVYELPAPPRPPRADPARPSAESLPLPFGDSPRTGRSTAAVETATAEGEVPDPDFTFDEPARDEAPGLGGVEEPDPDGFDEVEEEPRFVRGEDELRIEEEGSEHPLRPWLAFLALLLLVYANAALYLRNHAETALGVLGRIPLIGSLLVEDRFVQNRVLLENVEGSFQRLKDERVVFVVTGRAVNTARQPVRGVQIESTLYGAAGDPLETRSIYCGNAMSMKIVKDLSTKEVSLLQRLEPPQRFEIQPGESAGFTVVFTSPPQGLREFSARVVAAQKAVS